MKSEKMTFIQIKFIKELSELLIHYNAELSFNDDKNIIVDVFSQNDCGQLSKSELSLGSRFDGHQKMWG